MESVLTTEVKRRMKLRYYQRNPLAWMRDKLNIAPESIKWDMLPKYQNHTWDRKDPSVVTPNPLYRILKALVQHKDVGVEAATGVGKSYLAAAISLWFVDVYRKIVDPQGNVIDPGGLVITVATKESQLRSVLWKEIGKFEEIFTRMNPKANFMDLKLRMDETRADKESWGIFGQTASVGADEESSTAFQGYHSPHMLFILDEVPGIHPAILEAIDNTAIGGHNMRLFLGNPTSVTDTLHQFCQHPDTEHIRVAALDHPNIVYGREVVPGAVTKGSISRRMKKYDDPDHRMILSRVHGVAPQTSGMAMFSDDAIKDTGVFAEKEPVRRMTVRGAAKGELRIHEEARHDVTNRYVIFGDVAGDKSRSGDYHAAVVLDRIERKPVAVLHMRGPRTDYVTWLLALCKEYVIKYGQTGRRVKDPDTGTEKDEKISQWPLLAYERNSGGALHLDERIMQYPNLYHKRSTDTPEKESIRASVGHHTNRSTRPDMMDELEAWALELSDHPERMTDEAIWNEARTFSWDDRAGRWDHETGCHDDTLMALAGALYIDKIVRDAQVKTSKYEPSSRQKPKRNAEKFLAPYENEGPSSSNPFDQAALNMGALPDFGPSAFA